MSEENKESVERGAGSEEGEQEEVQVEEVEDCAKCATHLDGWKRALADYDNLKKDLMKERGMIRQSAKEDVAHSLIAVLDNFDQAAKFQPEGLTGEAETWLVGIMHVRNQLESVMSELGLEPFCAPGEVFDPNLHEAAAEREEEGKKDQEILEVSMRGWKIGEKIVRPAKVVVNSNK